MTAATFFKAFLYGLVEGITEWLPISSTGHMILLSEFMPLDATPEFWRLFLVVIQLGAILAVLTLYWKRLFPLYFAKEGVYINRDILILWCKIAVACVPAGVVGILWDDVFDKYFYNFVCVAIALIVFGVWFIWVERRGGARAPVVTQISQISYAQAAIIGGFQLLAAVFPGTSRSGATILGGLQIGLSRRVATEFTFFMGVPVMFGASLLKLARFGLVFDGAELAVLLVGLVSAYIVSVATIRMLLGYIRRGNFIIFGFYRIALGLLCLLYAFLR